MDYRYIQKEVEMIHEHLSRGRVDTQWLVTHCEMLSHYAERLSQDSKPSNVIDLAEFGIPQRKSRGGQR